MRQLQIQHMDCVNPLSEQADNLCRDEYVDSLKLMLM